MKKITYTFLVMILAGSAALMGFTPPHNGNGDKSAGEKGKARKTAGTPLGLMWEEMGPNNIGTHARSIAMDASGNVFVGSAGGGLFKSTNGGSSWTVVEDGSGNAAVAENMTVSSIAIDGSNIYVGTGEVIFYEPDANRIQSWTYDKITSFKNGFHQYASSPGEGVFVSTDGGTTWNHSNGTWNASSIPFDDPFMSIQKVTADGGKVFVASMEGLYWSNDALNTVTKSNGTSYFMTNPITDVEFANGNTVYACTRDSFYISTDGGANFGSGLNTTGSDLEDLAGSAFVKGKRASVAVAPSDKNVAYVTMASGLTGNCTGVWKTTDNGSTWAQVAPSESSVFDPFGDAGAYAQVLEVYPNDPNSYIIAGDEWFTYSDTTGLIQNVTHFYFPGFNDDYVPTPIHGIAFDPSSSSTYYVATDKEIVKTTDNAESFNFKTKGFNAGHMISIAPSTVWRVTASDRFYGPISRGSESTDPAEMQFQKLGGFSGTSNGIGKVRSSLVNPDYLIGQGTDDGLIRSLTNGLSTETFYANPDCTLLHSSLTLDSIFIDRRADSVAGAGVYDGNAAPVVPWCMDEYMPSVENDSVIMNTPAYLYMCSRHFVWQVRNPYGTLDSLPNWNRLTNDLIDDTKPLSAEEYFTAIEVSGDANHVLYVGTNYGRIFRIYNADDPANLDVTTKVERVDDAGGTMPERWITSFAFDPNNTDNLVVTYAGYDSTGDSRVFVTNNALDTGSPVTFWDAQGDMPNIPVYSATFHPDAAFSSIILGTEKGIYTTTDNYNSATSLGWNKENMGIDADVPVYDVLFRRYVKIWTTGGHYKYGLDNTLFAATYGRGLFKSTSVVSVPDPIAEANADVTLFPNPSSHTSNLEIVMDETSLVKIELYDLKGQLVRSLHTQSYAAGTKRLVLDNSGLNNGIYFLKVRIESERGVAVKTIKTIIMK